MTVNNSLAESTELVELKAQIQQAKVEGNRWKQLYKDTEGELEAKTTRLSLCESERDHLRKLYTETLNLLKQEQADHTKTRDSLLKIIGDTIANKATN
jgi:chromosome segregation ATPase